MSKTSHWLKRFARNKISEIIGRVLNLCHVHSDANMPPVPEQSFWIREKQFEASTKPESYLNVFEFLYL